MATVSPARRVWTYADLEDVPDDDHIYDILKGELVVRNAPEDNHAEALTELFGLLYTAQEAGYGRVYSSGRAVALDFAALQEAAENVSHPDLFFVRQERLDTFRGRRAFEAPPDLIIEVLSRSTRGEHAPGGRWWNAYEQHGVPYYWLVDTDRQLIRQYALQGEPYVGGRYGEPVILRSGGMLTSPLFPTVSMPVDRVFRNVR